MTDLKIPNLNKNSEKIFFKKKLSLRRKSKGRLIRESYIMLSISTIIIFINYFIPNKAFIFNNFLSNLRKVLVNALNSVSYIYEICLFIFIITSLTFALILFIGSFSRILKVMRRKTSYLKYK